MMLKRAGMPIALAAIVVLASTDVRAVDGPVVGHFSFGVSLPQGDAGDALEDGWAFHGGATWFSQKRPNLGLRMDLGIDWFDVRSAVLGGIDTDEFLPGVQPPDNGYARAWSGTVDLLWSPSSQGSVGWYLVAGVGVYYTQAELSEDGFGVYCDPWWYWCYGVEGEYIIKSKSNWEWGLNAGAGLTFKAGPGTEFYLEAVYHWLDTKNSAELVPISLGVRW